VELLQRIDSTLLYPALLERVLAILEDCRSEGADYWAISGLRTPQEQLAIYEQGRTRPGHVVTQSKPWQSAHQYGLAVDFARDADASRTGLQPSWKAADYDILGRVAVRHGLVWGGHFKCRDAPHVQWPDFVTAKQLEPLWAIAISQPYSSPNLYLRRVWEAVAAKDASK
jgi:peptidoglycan L-alanyl-D-glutamate endopeptidase CwlK